MFGKTCCLCGKKAIVGERAKLKTQEFLCQECWHKSGKTMFGLSSMTLEEVKKEIKRIDEGVAETSHFKPTKTVVDRMNHEYFHVDEIHKEWYIPTRPLRTVPEIHRYDEIIGYELLEDSISITKGGIGSAIVGGALFGEVGAVVGATTAKRVTVGECSSLRVRIFLSDIQNPERTIEFVSTPVKKDSAPYKIWRRAADEIISILRVVLENNKKSQTEGEKGKNEALDDDEAICRIRKYKVLFDEGILSKEEFEAKKKQLLGI